MHLIVPGLAVGNAQEAVRPPRFAAVVLNVAAENRIVPPQGIPYLFIPFKEFAEPDPVKLEEAVAWLEQHDTQGRLLICCRAGIGRSVSVAIAYLCITKEMQYQEAVELVSSRRPGAMTLPGLEGCIQFVGRLRSQYKSDSPARWSKETGMD